VLAGGSAALLGAALLPLIAGQTGDAVALDVTHPAVAWSGALGAAAILAYAGSAARAASRGARSVALEVERQFRGFQRESGRVRLPVEFTPSYRSCIELAEKSALDRLLLSAGLALLLPALLGTVLRLMYRSSDPGLVTQGLTAFVVVASVTGLAAALAADGARVTLGAARRASRSGGVGPGFAAALSGNAVADVLGNVSGPAAHLLMKGAAITALVAAPFLV
jgi:K(+)-stimulated pyrophosphate-energized sodium pump